MSAPSGVITGSSITVPNPEIMRFLKLTARDQEGTLLSDNFYWINRHNSFLPYNELTSNDMRIQIKPFSSPERGVYTVTLKNTGSNIAFMLSMRIAGKESHQEILPSYWSDNYFSLLPGEEKTVTVDTALSGMLEVPAFEYKTYNMKDFISVDMK